MVVMLGAPVDWFAPVFELVMFCGLALFVFLVAFAVDRLLPDRLERRKSRKSHKSD